MYGKHTAALMVVFTITLFMLGGGIGAQVATNESVTLENTTNELDRIPQNVTQSIQNNSSGLYEDVMLSTVQAPVNVITESAKAGVRFGYHNPTVGRVLPPVSFLMLFGYVGYASYKYANRIKKRAKENA